MNYGLHSYQLTRNFHMKEVTISVPKFIEHCRSYDNSHPSRDVIQDAVENFYTGN